ncbi:MAG: polysaccharide biosynthesis C-terminal domain-containing protein, partial [Candidatus Zixiibacteriota bacterium]
GVYSFLIVIAWTVIFQTDNIVIAGFLSTEAVAVYSVPAMMVTQLRNSITAISIPLVPAISHFEALKDYQTIMRVYTKSTRYLHYISGYICISVLIFGGPFILLWVKKDFVDAIGVLRILIFAGAFTFPQIIANSVLLGVSKHRLTFYILGSEAVANLVLSLILVQSFGIAGVAWGTAIPQLIIYIFVYPRVFYKAMEANVRDFYITAAKSAAYSIVFVLPAAYIMYKLLMPDSWLYLIIDCLVVTGVMIAGLVGVILDESDRERAFGIVRKILGRSKS